MRRKKSKRFGPTARGGYATAASRASFEPIEWFTANPEGDTVFRNVRLRNGSTHKTQFSSIEPLLNGRRTPDVLASTADLLFLQKTSAPPLPRCATRTIRVADLFSGCGLMSLGIREACRAVGKSFESALAVDANTTALTTYEKNFAPCRTVKSDIAKYLNGRLGHRFTKSEKLFMRGLGRIDILVGGPPCQGHSDLNNHTRRSDPKNGLYDRMARFSELVRPKHVIIENVPAVIHDHSNVVDRTIKHLRKLGYKVSSGFVEMSRIGVPQSRRRHVVVASRQRLIDIDATIETYARRERSVGWALSSLLRTPADRVIDQPSAQSKQTRKRIKHLFENNLYDLPNKLRPKCHQSGDHSYKSIYGRQLWNEPAQTITTGFNTMGCGRFVHAKKHRTITPHEAARLQFIPDFFKFDDVQSRVALAEMIGNAVPPKLTYIFALELLR